MYKIKSVDRNSLYHNAFQYSVSGHLFEAACLRRYGSAPDTHRALDQRITHAKNVRRHPNYGGSWRISDRTRDITEKDATALHCFLDWHLQDKQPHKLSISTHWIDIFVNDVESLYDEEFFGFLQDVQIKRANVCIAENTILLRNPEHSFRIMFRDRRLDSDQRNKLREFIANQSNEIRINPAFADWLKADYHYIFSSFFIDCNNRGYETLLQLLIPGIVRKTLHILPR